MVGSAVPTTVESMAATKMQSISPAMTRTSCGVQGMDAGTPGGPAEAFEDAVDGRWVPSLTGSRVPPGRAPTCDSPPAPGSGLAFGERASGLHVQLVEMAQLGGAAAALLQPKSQLARTDHRVSPRKGLEGLDGFGERLVQPAQLEEGLRQ